MKLVQYVTFNTEESCRILAKANNVHYCVQLKILTVINLYIFELLFKTKLKLIFST